MTRLQAHDSLAKANHFQSADAGITRSQALPAKGYCWYCDKPVDNVRRFCSPGCRHDYQEEENGFPQVEMRVGA